MSTISNRFFVTALDDGTTLHGNLSSDKPLSQGWNGSAIPNWTVAANQPTIYLTLINGTTLVQPITQGDSAYKWYYNGVLVTFDINTNISNSSNANGLFQKTSRNVTYGGTTLSMPALKIVKNIATSDNVDMDTISFQGSYLAGNTPIPFQASTVIRITRITATGYLGVLSYVNGIADITEPLGTVTLYETLYGGESGDRVTSGYTVQWLINGTPFDTTTFPNSQITTHDGHVALRVDERDITDHATIQCAFIIGGETVFTAYAYIDDMQDPEYMYIQYNGANGNAASLRTGESATFSIWVGSRENPAVNTSYTTFKVQLLNSDGNIITGTVEGFNNADANGWRTLSVTQGIAQAIVSYAVVAANGKNMTGIILAQTA